MYKFGVKKTQIKEKDIKQQKNKYEYYLTK